MKISQIITNLGIGLMVLLTGCAFTTKTDIVLLDSKFLADSGKKKLGIIKFDFHTIEPLNTDQTIAAQFGLIGALVSVANQNAKNSKDNTIDTAGVMLYQKSLVLLKERLQSCSLIPLADSASEKNIDPLALSRHIRDTRLFGSTSPTHDEIAQCTRKYAYDYVLYNGNWGGIYKNEDKLFVSGKWQIYNSAGNEVVSVFTMSIDKKTVPDSLTPGAMAEKLLKLFNQNIDSVVNVITKGGK